MYWMSRTLENGENIMLSLTVYIVGLRIIVLQVEIKTWSQICNLHTYTEMNDHN